MENLFWSKIWYELVLESVKVDGTSGWSVKWRVLFSSRVGGSAVACQAHRCTISCTSVSDNSFGFEGAEFVFRIDTGRTLGRSSSKYDGLVWRESLDDVRDGKAGSTFRRFNGRAVDLVEPVCSSSGLARDSPFKSSLFFVMFNCLCLSYSEVIKAEATRTTEIETRTCTRR
jgi:hypothetical protein